MLVDTCSSHSISIITSEFGSTIGSLEEHDETNSNERLTNIDRNKLLKSLKALEVYPLTTYHMTNQARRKICLINFSPRLFCLGYSRAIMLKGLFE